MKRKVNHSSTPLLRGSASIPQLISPPYGSPSHWNHHSSRVDCGLGQLSSHDYVRTSIHTLRRSGEHRDILLYEGFDDRFPHRLLLFPGRRSTIHNSSGHGLSGCCKDSASDGCQNPIINSRLKAKLRGLVKEIENAKAKDCSESK